MKSKPPPFFKQKTTAWRFRIVGTPGQGPFFVVRENAHNNSAFGPFTRASFPLQCRVGGTNMLPQYLHEAQEAIKQVDLLARKKNGSLVIPETRGRPPGTND